MSAILNVPDSDSFGTEPQPNCDQTLIQDLPAIIRKPTLPIVLNPVDIVRNKSLVKQRICYTRTGSLDKFFIDVIAGVYR